MGVFQQPANYFLCFEDCVIMAFNSARRKGHFGVLIGGSKGFIMECPPRIQCRDRLGFPFEVGECNLDDLSHLMGMYHVFSPKPASQGLPPPEPATCRKWARSLFEKGFNLLAWRENRVIGHAALIKDFKGESGEFVIFVHQNFRNSGIGTELTRLSIQKAKELGLTSMWLTVSMNNFIAVKLYRNQGFKYSDMDECERTMILKL
jgi:GNAT superfamily N-acetyltransferase